MGSGLVEARTGGADRRDCLGPAVADAETARNLTTSRSMAPYLRVLSLTPRELPIRRLVTGATVLD
jgi:hypothetical protein